eukprot:1186038-Prorocentrum_minimum.AAC.2
MGGRGDAWISLLNTRGLLTWVVLLHAEGGAGGGGGGEDGDQRHRHRDGSCHPRGRRGGAWRCLTLINGAGHTVIHGTTVYTDKWHGYTDKCYDKWHVYTRGRHGYIIR